MRKRAPWVCYRDAACDREQRVSGTTSLVWPLILKAALPGNGRISFFPHLGPARQLRQILGGRPEFEGRFYQIAIDELTRAKLIRVEEDAIWIEEWREFMPRKRRTDELDTRRWLRLYGYESPSFRRLPPLVRGFAHWLMRAVGDYEGTAVVEEDFLLGRLGWLYSRTYRHLRYAGHVPTWLAILKADGYLIADESDPGLAVIRNFKAMQPAVRPDGDEGVTRGSRGGDEGGVEGVTRGGSRGSRGGDELLPKVPELLNSPPQEGKKEGRKDQIPPTPRAAGGGQAELFRAGDPGPDRRGAGAKPDRRNRQRRMPAPVPRPAAGYPAAFEAAFDSYPNHRGLKPQAFGCWLALAAELGEAKLLERVTAHLGWKVGSHWADGIGIPAFERYLHQRWFVEDRPANPEAERPPARGAPRDFEAERRATTEENRRRSIAAAEERRRVALAAEAEAAAKAVPPLEAYRQRALGWTDFRKDRNCANFAYHRPGDPATDAVLDEVLLARLAEFRQAYPADPLPRIMREFLVAKPQHAERAAPRPAPAPAAAPVQNGRRYIRPGGWPPPFVEAGGKRTAASASLRLVSDRAAPPPAPPPPPALADPARQLRERMALAAERLERLEKQVAQQQPRAGSG